MLIVVLRVSNESLKAPCITVPSSDMASLLRQEDGLHDYGRADFVFCRHIQDTYCK